MTDTDEKFYIETLSSDNKKWIGVTKRYWDEKKFQFSFEAVVFDSLEKAWEHAKNLNTVFRVKVVTFYYGDFVMPKSVLKLLDGKGYQVKGVKGVDPRKTFKNEADFSEHYQDISVLNSIGVSLYTAKKWDQQSDPQTAQKLVWEGISKLTVNEQAPKQPKEGVTYRFNVKDPTVWDKAPAQVKVILNELHRNKVEEIKSTEVKTMLDQLVESKALVTRQDPMRVFAYYVTDKKRGFKAFNALAS